MMSPVRYDPLILRRLLWLRWGVLIGQVVVLWLGNVLGMHLPLGALLMILGLEAVVNLLSMVRVRMLQKKGRTIADVELAAQLLFDIGALSVLLYLTGGATNPFVSFYLPSLAIAAALLPWKRVAGLGLVAFVAYSFMLFYYQPLHLHDPDNAVSAHLGGMWLNFIASAVLLAGFVARLSSTLRQRDAELAAAREQLLRDARIDALGAQAASAAHEIGTPLATIAVVTGELRRDAEHAAHAHAPIGQYREDLQTIEQQLALCKAALGRLQLHGAPQVRSRLGAWLPEFARNWRLRHPHAELQVDAPDQLACTLIDAVAVGQILTILLDNAAQSYDADSSRVRIALCAGIEGAMLYMRVTDDGRGISPEVLALLGRKPVSSTSAGQGVGLFLAQSAAQRLGGRIVWHSTRGVGTRAELCLPYAAGEANV